MDEHLDFCQMVVWDSGKMGMGWHYRRSYETVLVGMKLIALLVRRLEENRERHRAGRLRHQEDHLCGEHDHPTPEASGTRRALCEARTALR